MNQEFSTALMLLAVGMITVFTVLALIVILSKALILLVNGFFPGSQTVTVKGGQKKIDPRKVAAIVSAVDIVSKGKATVTSISESEVKN